MSQMDLFSESVYVENKAGFNAKIRIRLPEANILKLIHIIHFPPKVDFLRFAVFGKVWKFNRFFVERGDVGGEDDRFTFGKVWAADGTFQLVLGTILFNQFRLVHHSLNVATW